jgi:hypothetical protein
MPTEVKQTPFSERTAVTISFGDMPGLAKIVAGSFLIAF